MPWSQVATDAYGKCCCENRGSNWGKLFSLQCVTKSMSNLFRKTLAKQMQQCQLHSGVCLVHAIRSLPLLFWQCAIASCVNPTQESGPPSSSPRGRTTVPSIICTGAPLRFMGPLTSTCIRSQLGHAPLNGRNHLHDLFVAIGLTLTQSRNGVQGIHSSTIQPQLLLLLVQHSVKVAGEHLVLLLEQLLDGGHLHLERHRRLPWRCSRL